jgi:hypothetical protein
MIRTRTQTPRGRSVILLGLSRENIRLLVDENKPIALSGSMLGLPAIEQLVIMFGETEDSMTAELLKAKLIDERTVVVHTTPDVPLRGMPS